MVPHARFELMESGYALRGIGKQETFVMRITLDTDDAVADASLDPRGRNLQALRDIGNGQPSGDVARTH